MITGWCAGRTPSRFTLARLALTSVMVASPAAAFAQTSLQIPLQFDFLNPGAKSLALAGSFVGLADDATATFANPAGLVQLGVSEVSVELRGSWISSQFLQGGRLSGEPTNMGTDTIAGAVFGTSEGSHVGPGFLAGVYVHPSHQWVIAGYRHELVRVDQSFSSNGVFLKDPSSINSARDISQEGIRDVDITGYGVSGSYRVTPVLAIGASITAYSFTMDSTFRRLNTDGFFGPPLPNVPPLSTSTQTGDDISWAPTLGVMIGRDAFRFGGVYRHGASFDMTTQSTAIGTRQGLFRVPDTLAFGASARIAPTLTVAAEITRVSYSRLREDFVTDQAFGSGRVDLFTVNDATEIHGGVQYVVPRWPGLPRFRGGVWYDPDHSVEFTPSSVPTDRLFNERLTAALSTGKNQVHVTGGIGLTFGRHLEFNVAFDAASTTNIFSSSLIVR